MRTTVTLDPDVEALVRKLMRERGIGFKAALNEAIRSGLRPPGPGHPVQAPPTPTFKMGFAPEANLDKALALAARLEDEALARKLSLRK
jgi:hypothetical protein